MNQGGELEIACVYRVTSWAVTSSALARPSACSFTYLSYDALPTYVVVFTTDPRGICHQMCMRQSSISAIQQRRGRRHRPCLAPEGGIVFKTL